MDIQRVTFATSGDVATAVRELAVLAPGEEGFRDADAWFHVDVPTGGTGGSLRLAVSGPDGGVGAPTLLLKVPDVNAARRELQEAGIDTGPVEPGAHERRFMATLTSMPGLRVVVYSPLG
jgi:hypothetical protein